MSAYFGQTDTPITDANEEYLGLGHYVEALGNFILTCQTPLTISIQGDWGTGKTSMMNLVRENLKKEQGTDKVATFWFNAWQFSQFSMQDDIAISLLSTLLNQLSDNPNTQKLLTGIPRKAIGYVGQTTGRDALDELTDDDGDAFKNGIDSLTKRTLSTDSDPARQISKIKEELNKAIIEYLTKEKASRLAVFVDDMDCLIPEKAVELLEVIKLFLDVPQCVYVLAVDYNVVAQGLEKKFGFSMDSQKSKSFFEKIIQLPFNLPTTQYNTRSYLQQLLGHNTKIDGNKLDLYVRLATLSIGSNPRSLKRLFNALQLLEMIAKHRTIMTADAIASAEERYRILFAVMCLQLAYPAAYEFIIKQRDILNDNFLRSLFNLETLRKNKIATVLQKALGEECLERFTRFMQTFYETLQLQSNQSKGGNEILVQAELDILLSFLSFSSLTVSSSEIQPLNEQNFHHKQAITAFMNKVLTPKFYKHCLEPMHIQFACWFSSENGGITFPFKLGAMNFKFCVSWWGNNGISVYLDDPEIAFATKDLAIEWFQHELKGAFPTPEINKRKTQGYMVLKKYPFAQGIAAETEAAKLETFKLITVQMLTEVMPKLAELYASRQLLIQQLQNFTERLVQKLEKNYPASEGWIIENNLKNLCQWNALQISKTAWNKKLAIVLDPAWHHLTYLGFGLHKLEGKHLYNDDMENQLFSECQSLFSDGNSDSSWFFRQVAKNEYQTLAKVSVFDVSGLYYAFATQEQENAALDYYSQELSKFRQIETQLDALAASAKL